jgi:hypothetical protein
MSWLDVRPSLFTRSSAEAALPTALLAVVATCHGFGSTRPCTYTRQRCGRAQISGTAPIRPKTTPQTIQPPLTLPPRKP